MNVSRNKAQTLHDGEARVTCDRDDCDWSTIRPEQHAWSAAEAHRIAHTKGMFATPTETKD